jgi:hypothetical protein
MLIIKFLIVFIIVLLFCQLFLATVQEGFKEGVDDSSCPGVNQIPLLQNQTATLQTKVAELEKQVTYLNDANNEKYKTDVNIDDLQANANPEETVSEEPEEEIM